MASRLSSNVIRLQRNLTQELRKVLRLSPSCSQIHDNKLQQVCMTRRFKSRDARGSLSSIIQPLPITPTPRNDGDTNAGEELSGTIAKEHLMKFLQKFYKRDQVKNLAFQNGLDSRLFHKAYISFRKFCVTEKNLPVDLHIIFSDILQGSGNVDDIFPYFLEHCYKIFPHLECMEDLKKISDLQLPANWYPEARSIERKFIFHAGPTNSGKTYHALERFMESKSGIYCGPLKLLASEVFTKSNKMGTPCDLVTGEERRFATEDGTASPHIACTVEMANLTTPYEVAVIDEIQMIKDQQRGWAWTRAVLGLYAHEIHLCGEASTIDLVKELAFSTGEEVEVRRYERLTNLTYLDHAVEKFENVRPGDCIVCFNKNDIYYVTRQLDLLNVECAVVYGSLPPSAKIVQSEKFNDINDSCKVMVATDAIGMGLNLAIKRVIFYSVMKPMLNDKGDVEIDLISTSQALQIAGRAGRYNTIYENGEVTTFYARDLKAFKEIIEQPLEPIMQGGLHPTADQIEMFAYHLPKATLSNLIDIFEMSCELDSDMYFMCKSDDFKFLAETIEHVPLPLRVRYVFCCAPIPVKQPFACALFLKFARRFSRSEPLTLDWLCRQICWPVLPPKNLVELVHLECVFDITELYLWLSYRFQDMFPHAEMVRELQKELDTIIQLGINNIVQLVKNQQQSNALEQGQGEEEDFPIEMPHKQEQKRLIEEGLQLKEAIEKKEHAERKIAHRKLASRLIGDGTINKGVLEQLQSEWKADLVRKNRFPSKNDDSY